MAGAAPQYISVSRRTEIPRFYVEAFFEAWRRGEITYDGGYGRSYTVSLKPADVLGYIFWSKDFSRLVAHPDFTDLLRENNAIFHYTINDAPLLEPGVAPLETRLVTLDALCALVGPERVFWRYDPLCRYRSSDGTVVTNEAPFHRILPRVAAQGVRVCYFSFMTAYAKTARRGTTFLAFDDAEKKAVCARMAAAAREHGVILYNCCNPECVDPEAGILKAHCIDDTLLAATDRFGVHRPLASAPTRPGCGCHASRDIGSYLQRCGHGCAYCYANPA